MSRTDLIKYILENDEQFTMEELVAYRYEELVVIKCRVELEKAERQNEFKGKINKGNHGN